MLKQSAYILWLDLKNIKFENLWIFMKTLEINEKSRKIQGMLLQNHSYLTW